MTATIRILPDNLVNKIAAGEVIVRPASVVKELLENALDAGASRISIEVGNECCDIRVRDDGCGMSREDAQLALVRHATSKITEFDDLWTLRTRGFRGEALASIAAVARVQILTRRRGEMAGTRITAEGPAQPQVEAAGAPEGTDVRVRDLFFNTPARRKFLKTPAAELQQVLAVVTRQALIRPDVGMTVTGENGTLLDVPPAQPWAERIASLLGLPRLEDLFDLDNEIHGVRVRGYILNPGISRKDRRHQFFNVCGRPIASRTLSYVLQEACKGLIMVQRFPVVVMDVTVPPGEVDVNVHPTKEEVRFRREPIVMSAVHHTVIERLRMANLMPTLDLGTGKAPLPPATQEQLPWRVNPADAWPKASTTIPGDFTVFTGPPPAVSVAASAGTQAPLPQAPPSQPAPHPQTSEGPCAVRPLQHSLSGISESGNDPVAAAVLLRAGELPEPLGQVGLCYIVARAGDDLLLIDQHAAHERLLYLKLAARTGKVPSQPLLIPVSVDVPAVAVAYMNRLLPVLAELGISVEPFGGQTYLVQSVPADLPSLDPALLLADMLDDFESLGRVEEVAAVRDRVVTRMACRAAIKAGQPLSLDEMRALIRDLAGARLSFTCPHGRPTMILLTRDQLDKQFKRKV
ncbi:MAG: DNA mismatch repair endonuclease MutL [Candidatus Sumerlaeaceae bacterium]|nr:DNA mismatch repair endonuclease MutL [Candidatus Sumerlaeaceae bacterium]